MPRGRTRIARGTVPSGRDGAWDRSARPPSRPRGGLPSSAAKKPLRALLAVTVCCAAVSALATPAVSQGNQQILREEEATLRQQEQRRDELTEQIAEMEAAVQELARQISESAGQAAVTATEIELLADEFEETVDERREPEATRVKIAIATFRHGDTRQSGLIDEIKRLDNRSESNSRRVLHGAVVNDTTRRLDALDVRLQGLNDKLAQTRRRAADLQQQLEQQRGSQQELTGEIAAAREELETTLVAIQNTNTRIEIERAKEIRALLTGLTIDAQVSRPALAVKIDNIAPAMPQSGINEADIVFVEEVEGATRLAAVFHSTAPNEIGPVRSMRTGDVDLLTQLNGPLFANSGGNRGTRAAVNNSTLVDVGAGTAGHLYYRSPSRRAPHNLYTNAANLWSEGSSYSRAGAPPPIFTFREPNEPLNSTAVAASSINIAYAYTRVQYSWNGSGWNRTQDGNPTVDTAGVRTSPATVIVQFTNYRRSAADSRSPEAITVGSGSALVFTDGQVVEATWSRPRATDVTVYTDSEGRPVSILPGRTWVELPRPDSTTYS